MRPSSLGGGRILRRTLFVRLSVCPYVPLSLPSVTSRHLANYNDTHVLFGTRWGPHIVRTSRPHRFVLLLLLLLLLCRSCNLLDAFVRMIPTCGRQVEWSADRAAGAVPARAGSRDTSACCRISYCHQHTNEHEPSGFYSQKLSFCLSVHFNGHFSRWTWHMSAGLIEAKDNGCGGDNWSCKPEKLSIAS